MDETNDEDDDDDEDDETTRTMTTTVMTCCTAGKRRLSVNFCFRQKKWTPTEWDKITTNSKLYIKLLANIVKVQYNCTVKFIMYVISNHIVSFDLQPTRMFQFFARPRWH